MISLEQIRALESKVHKAVALLSAAQEENKLLKERLASYETRVDELEFMIEEFKEEQSEIEQGIISALQHLDSLEDAVGGMKTSAPASDATPRAEKPDHHTKAEAPAKAETPAKPEPARHSAENDVEPSHADAETAESADIEDRGETADDTAGGEDAPARQTATSWEAESADTVEDFSDEEDPEAQKDQRQLDIF